jgi:hypothetical protein
MTNIIPDPIVKINSNGSTPHDAEKPEKLRPEAAYKPYVGTPEEEELMNGTDPSYGKDAKQGDDADAEESPAGEDAQLFEFLEWGEAAALLPKAWLIDQILGHGDLAMIYGAPGSGKTFVGLDLAFSAAMGKLWAGRFEVARSLTVAYCTNEGKSGLPQRLQAAGSYYNAGKLPNLYICMTAPQLFDTQDPCNAAKFIGEYAARQAAGKVAPLDILILDTLHSVSYGAGENDTKDMGEVIKQAKRIAERLGCAIILVHHSNKAGTGERGSSALRGAMDCMIEVKEVGGGRVMSCEKSKDGEKWKPQTFDLMAKDYSVRVEWGQIGEVNKDSGYQTIDKERLIDVMLKTPNTKFTVSSLAEVIGKGENHTRNLLSQMERDGQCVRELSDPEKTHSSRNPWLYSLSPFGQRININF